MSRQRNLILVLIQVRLSIPLFSLRQPSVCTQREQSLLSPRCSTVQRRPPQRQRQPRNPHSTPMLLPSVLPDLGVQFYQSLSLVFRRKVHLLTQLRRASSQVQAFFPQIKVSVVLLQTILAESSPVSTLQISLKNPI